MSINTWLVILLAVLFGAMLYVGGFVPLYRALQEFIIILM